MKKYIKVQSLICKVLFVSAFILFAQSCSKEETVIDNVDHLEYLSISKSDFDFARDWEGLSENDKNAFELAQKRMNFTLLIK
jgi:hypothetical protein